MVMYRAWGHGIRPAVHQSTSWNGSFSRKGRQLQGVSNHSEAVKTLLTSPVEAAKETHARTPLHSHKEGLRKHSLPDSMEMGDWPFRIASH